MDEEAYVLFFSKKGFSILLYFLLVNLLSIFECSEMTSFISAVPPAADHILIQKLQVVETVHTLVHTLLVYLWVFIMTLVRYI
jgi:hypothetical protein